MTRLADHFADCLDETVNLNQSRIDQLDARLASVERFLTEHAHKTIIKPLANHDFDVDVLVPMVEQTEIESRDYADGSCVLSLVREGASEARPPRGDGPGRSLRPDC